MSMSSIIIQSRGSVLTRHQAQNINTSIAPESVSLRPLIQVESLYFSTLWPVKYIVADLEICGRYIQAKRKSDGHILLKIDDV